ncbi:ABC transporter permease [Planctomyces sp. SH-PL62]|uniref:ABC transporter permease n=1 Tax=Planctomyces sp. SH-PL62 TaxID=1636152 RepID=UPI00078DDAE3|nr:ABC transporter permease [Planctomyces sp. SH-PL62]AMV38757.1 Macrolide export ATP-binding/permease protein MacB [Planctomyces sp. SH-PL62]
MGLSIFVLRNILGRPSRTILTVVGLGVGIAAVVMLTGISRGFERAMTAIYDARGIDLIVVRAGISDQLSSNLDENLGEVIREIPGVGGVARSLMDSVSFEESNLASVLANGWEPGGLLMRGLRVVDGRLLEEGDARSVLLGRVLALNLGKKVGDSASIAGEPFRVVGVYESDSLFENGGLVVPLRELQRMMGREGMVTGLVVAAKPGVDPKSLGEAIEGQLDGVAAVPARDYVQGNVQLRLARAMAVATTGVAVALGSIGLLNTMAMAVFERTSEIGLLRALGWRRRRIIQLLMGEAAAIVGLGVLAGWAMATLGMRALMLSPTSRGFIDPNLPAYAYVAGLAMGAVLGLMGGLYPAIRASRLEPTEALRHE